MSRRYQSNGISGSASNERSTLLTLNRIIVSSPFKRVRPWFHLDDPFLLVRIARFPVKRITAEKSSSAESPASAVLIGSRGRHRACNRTAHFVQPFFTPSRIEGKNFKMRSGQMSGNRDHQPSRPRRAAERPSPVAGFDRTHAGIASLINEKSGGFNHGAATARNHRYRFYRRTGWTRM